MFSLVLCAGFLAPASPSTDAQAQAAIAIAYANRQRQSGSSASVAVPVRTAAHPVAGWHAHICPNCGNRWEHGADANGSRAAHTCANCGTLVLHKSPAAPPVQSAPAGHWERRFCPSCPGGYKMVWVPG